MQYTYFVSYAVPGGFGQCKISRNAPIESYEDVEQLLDNLKKDLGHSELTIITWIPLSK